MGSCHGSLGLVEQLPGGAVSDPAGEISVTQVDVGDPECSVVVARLEGAHRARLESGGPDGRIPRGVG